MKTQTTSKAHWTETRVCRHCDQRVFWMKNDPTTIRCTVCGSPITKPSAQALVG